MSVLVLGMNHRTAPVEAREKLAFTREGIANALLLFRKLYPAAEAAILCTCNRVEVVVSSDAAHPDADDVVAFLAQARDVPADAVRHHLYRHAGSAAIAHLFRVISGLDSMVLGEAQIVNQIKQAYAAAHEQGTAGPTLHRLFHHAFGVSKRVRSDTGVGDGKLSVPSVAVDLIAAARPDLAAQRVLVVGAGEMAQHACRYLAAAGARHITVTTRTLASAKALAESCGGRAAPFVDLERELVNADIVIAATSCPVAILGVERMRWVQGLRGNRPLLLIDLAVPRNVEHGVGDLANVVLHDVDALGRIADENYRQRAGALDLCERIVAEEVVAFEQWVGEARVKPLIDQMYRDVRELANMELRRLFQKCPDLVAAHRDAVAQLAERLVAKLMHPCVSTMRQQAASSPPTALADAFRALRLGFEQRCPGVAGGARETLALEV